MARTTRNYETVGWQDGTVLQPAKVTVQGTEYEVTPQVESGTTPVNANNLRHMDNEIQRIVEEDIPSVLDVELIAVSDTAPSEFSTGDKYYNTEDKKIYTATSSAWENAETPEEGISYIVFETQTSYAWNGTDLISVGGGSGSSDIIIIGDETEATEDTKVIIEDEDLDFQPEEIVNEESNSTQKGYSAKYTNDRNTYSTNEVFTGKYWIDGKKIYRKVITITLSNNFTQLISNVNSLTNYIIKVKQSDGTIRPYTYFSNVDLALTSSNIAQIRTTSTSGAYGFECTITIEYTKESE